MKLLAEKESTYDGITLHTIATQKYKTNTVILKVKAPLNKDDVTIRALLPYVLQSGSKNYPSTMKLRSYLDGLYGATLNVDVSKKGEEQILTFSIEIANEKFLSDQTPLLKKAIDLLADIIFNPNLTNGMFNTDTVEKEKRSLKQKIQSVNDDKMRYANLRLVQEMCKDEAYSLHTYGVYEDVDSITSNMLSDYYRTILKSNKMDLYVIGDIDEGEVESLVSASFTRKDSSIKEEAAANSNIVPEKVNEVFEEQDVNQGKLHIGYRTFTTFKDDDYYALQLFNGIFGGFSHSKLFLNVREKESLAYYAASRYESHKGLLMVMSGIEFENYNKAVTIINEQMDAMKNGDFSEQEIEQTKAVIKNQLLETADTARGLAEILYHFVVAGVKRPLDEWLQAIDKVTKEEITAVAQKIKLDTIYFLKGLGDK
jgi:predicted Zn-dependent peptidase